MQIIKFGKKGCLACDQVDNFLTSKGIPFRSINPFETETEEEDNLVLDNRVITIPVTILVNNGEVVARKAGYNEKALNSLIELYNGG